MKQLAERIKALSDPTRLRIISLLANGELCICDLMEGLALPQSRISRHMSMLKNAGWVEGRRSGKWTYYSLVKPGTKVADNILAVLCEGLPECSQSEEDHKRLTLYLKTKKNVPCD
ncbi:metalloregulator ArsR/SmtB family transcription factor [Maridesulfovibrio sp.]|uniref:ArsR/SmtB family transcription factor n=1 Tax=Maridesulfovibrio sp. TaxID=2795000 RepID=UPI0029CA6A54|nr:metalloregulator ArsR/SmtB family transcription factor [Maridesulfovibrio sp.]